MPPKSFESVSTKTTPAETQTRPFQSWVEVHRGHLIHNVEMAKRLAGHGVRVIAVIKANGYGHGLEIVARTLEPHVGMFGVTRFSEALRLREFGVEVPILLLGPQEHDHIRPAIQARCVFTVSSVDEATEINREARKLGQKAEAHVKIDTGMGRLGLPFRTAALELERINHLSELRITGLFTHFPVADARETAFTYLQAERFQKVHTLLQEKGISIQDVHLSNSSAIARYGAMRGTLVRPGLMLYGVTPGGVSSKQKMIELKPVLSWRTKIMFIKTLEKGDSCGYGRIFVAKHRMRVAWVPVGYSHGYPFGISPKAFVLIRGKRYPLAGRISMDFLAVALGEDKRIQQGDTVTLIGKDGVACVEVTQLAAWANTIPYEILTHIHSGISRVVLP